MENTDLENTQTFEEKNHYWIHTFIAISSGKVITTHSRPFSSQYVYALDKAFKITSNKILDRVHTQTFSVNEEDVYNVLLLFTDRDKQHMKEIDFIKICLSYLRSSDSKKIDITVINN